MMSAASVSPPPSKRARVDASAPAEPSLPSGQTTPPALCACSGAVGVAAAAPSPSVDTNDRASVDAEGTRENEPAIFSPPPPAPDATNPAIAAEGGDVGPLVEPPPHAAVVGATADDLNGIAAAPGSTSNGSTASVDASDDDAAGATTPPGLAPQPSESDVLVGAGSVGAPADGGVTADAAECRGVDDDATATDPTQPQPPMPGPPTATPGPPSASLPAPSVADAGVMAVAEAFRRADRVLVLAGAGFSAGSKCSDGSRLPDYRSSNTFAATFPALAARGLSYRSIATPAFFERDPETAWGFYATRVAMYSGATPHEGYDVLRRLVGERPCFVATSNVDGFFARAGFPAVGVCEVHGSLERVQCSRHARHGVWRASKALRGTAVDPATMRASPVPNCRAARCGAIARPNVLLFNDLAFAGGGTESQRGKLAKWVGESAAQGARVLVLELGAGAAVPTIRELFAACSLDLAGQGCEVDAVRVNLALASSDEPFVVGGSGRYHRLEKDARAAMAEVEAALASAAAAAAT